MKKFETLGVIGIGAYGIVLKAKHRETGQIVAIKKFKESDSDETIRKISLREAKILKLVNHHNIVHLIESFRRKEKLHLVFEYLERTVLEVLEKTPNGLPPEQIRIYMFQVQKAIRYLHKNDIIHRDVKPENLLVNNDDSLKQCDFGFARKIVEGQRLTDYVATRWYRSPDQLLTDKYGKASDIWAIGCIMGELTDGKPLFPGKDQIDQLHLIMKVLGNLTPDLKELIGKNRDFAGIRFPDFSNYQTLEIRYRNRITGKALSFQKGTLAMSPMERLTADECLCHPYFEDLRVKDPELADLTKTLDPNRIESTKCTDGGQDTRMTSSTTKNNQVKIRIKTQVENPMQGDKNRKSLVHQSIEHKIPSPLTFSDHDINIGKNNISKTYYNLHLQNNQFENQKQITKQPQAEKKIYAGYTKYTTQGSIAHTTGEHSEIHKPEETRQTISQVKRQNFANNHSQNIGGRLQFDNSMGFDGSKNGHTSLSQIQKKYNFTSTTKFASQDKRIQEKHTRLGQSQGFGVYKGGMTNTNGFNKYDNLYGTNSFIKQLPTINGMSTLNKQKFQKIFHKL